MDKVLKNAFNKDKFEELLVAKWNQFIDSSKLLAFTLQSVNQNANNLVIISDSNIKTKGVSITLSRFFIDIENNGFNAWVEFNVPLAINKMAEGTLEIHISHDGNITQTNLLGNLFCSK